MERELIQELLRKFEAACYEYKGVECWSARELQEMFGYAGWTSFMKTLEKAGKACENAGENIRDHFVVIGRPAADGEDAEKEADDMILTRYACYLIAQNGDPAKPAIAFAQTYFALQTRQQEVIERHLLDVARVTARERLSKSEKKLSGIIYQRGVDSVGFANIRSSGDEALFGGFTTNDMKRKLSVPSSRPLADFLPTLTIKAKDFATELTSHNVVEKDLKGEYQISYEHVENNKAVRRMLMERGVRPENLPAAEDVKKVQRKLENEGKKVLKEVKKVQKAKR